MLKYYLACGQCNKPNHVATDYSSRSDVTDANVSSRSDVNTVTYNRDSNVICNDVTIANKHSRISDVTVVIYLRIVDVTRDVYTSCDVTATVHASCDVTTIIHSSCDVTATVHASCDVATTVHASCDVTATVHTSCDNNNSCAKHNNYITISNEQ
jgi:hypothetical protein